MSSAAEFAPTEFAELYEPATAFVTGSTVLIRFANADPENQRRFTDFLVGLAYGRGRFHRNEDGVTLTPASPG